ncbi:MAG: ribulose-phosphate 3-epimerase [Erysipelotrichaceae bacterium]|nr:ribulose-phosphate 3-epimerase [Erysipelotrichaceae bacterium]
MILAPSVLSMHYDDFMNELKQLNENVEWIHFDVMDGHFVPNLTFGPDILKAFRRNTDLFMDVHLMVDDPDFFSDVFAKAGADSIVFHYEAYRDIDKCIALIDKIHGMYLKAGISIKPGTAIEEIIPLLDKIDIFLLMSVEPGFGGQKFMEEAYDRIRFLKKYKEEHGLDYIIEIDGGVNDQNAHDIISSGADALVAGSFVFNGNIKENAARLRRCE